MYRRYRIVDERDLREATESLNAYLKTQPETSVVTPLRKRLASEEDADNVRKSQKQREDGASGAPAKCLILDMPEARLELAQGSPTGF